MQIQLLRNISKSATVLVALLLVLGSTGAVVAVTLNVPADYATIQGAINASSSGDTVLVSPGTYVENIKFSGKNILVKSTEGAATTTLEQGNGAAPLVSFVSNETRQAIFDGFRIKNSTNSTAVRCSNSNPTIARCIIDSNISVGISFSEGSPSIISNEILDNGGPGIAGRWGGTEEIEVVGNTIAGNYGPAIQIMETHCSVLIEYNRISQNRRGILLGYARVPVVIRHNLIANTYSENAIEVSNGVGFEISFNTIYGGVRGIDIPYAETFAAGTGNLIVGCSEWALYDPFHCLTRTMFWDNEQDWYSAYPISPARYVRANPEFTSPETGDFSLRCDSPAIDAGSPDLLDADGTRADIGAIPFNHRAHTPVAMDFSILGEDEFMVSSPKIYFAWQPATNSNQLIHIDTLFCVLDPVSGEQVCFTDTTIISQISAQLGYELEFGIDDDWSVAELLATGEITSTDTIVSYSRFPLSAGQTYYARLRLRDKTGWGCWRQLILRRNAAPSVPIHANPFDGARMSASDAHLTVRSVTDAELDTIFFDFEVYLDSEMSVIHFDTSMVRMGGGVGITAPVPGLEVGNSYWWRTRSYDRSDYSAWSTPTMFVAWSGRSFRVPEDFPTVQNAIDWAADNDTVSVSPGTYSVAAQLRDKALTFVGVAGAESTKFIGIENQPIFKEFAGAPRRTRLIGIHFDQIRNLFGNKGPVEIRSCRVTGKPDSGPRSTILTQASIVVDDCIFDGELGIPVIGGIQKPGMSISVLNSHFLTGNLLNPYDFGLITIRAEGDGAFEAVIQNNLFVGNFGIDGIEIDPIGSGRISENTLLNLRRGIVLATSSDVQVVNNIVAGCSEYGITAYSASCDYNNFWSNSANYSNTTPGPNDISVDPLFVDPANGDYSLMCNSPCIDAGDPASAGFAGKRRDIGAFEYQYSIGNADGRFGSTSINLTDAVFLVNYIFLGGPAACPAGAGMVDCDNLTTISDVVYLVNYLYSHGPAPCVNNP